MKAGKKFRNSPGRCEIRVTHSQKKHSPHSPRRNADTVYCDLKRQGQEGGGGEGGGGPRWSFSDKLSVIIVYIDEAVWKNRRTLF